MFYKYYKDKYITIQKFGSVRILKSIITFI